MKILKVLAYVLAGFVVLVAGALTYAAFVHPDARAPQALQVQATPERIARGDYLFHHVSACVACHAERDYTKFGGPVVAGREAVGSCLPAFLKLPGEVCAPNLTSDRETGLGGWSDGEIARAIREGVSRDGHALFPMMPYKSYAAMSDEDVASLIAYLRTLPAVRHPVPRSRLAFPLNLLVKFMPSPLKGPVAPPDATHRGEYLTSIAACGECHSSDDNGRFAGGEPHGGVAGPEIPINLTPDPATGIGSWSKDTFLGQFQAFTRVMASPTPGKSVMPWISYSGMSPADLTAIFDYLHSLKPVRRAVQPG